MRKPILIFLILLTLFFTRLPTAEAPPYDYTPQLRFQLRFQKNLDLLSRLIHAEARGEPYHGKVAVGAVVVNRAELSGRTIEDIIKQKGQFATPSRGTNEECIRAAREALTGVDPTGGAVYFYNPKTATDEWIRMRQVVGRIGDHVFAK